MEATDGASSKLRSMSSSKIKRVPRKSVKKIVKTLTPRSGVTLSNKKPVPKTVQSNPILKYNSKDDRDGIAIVNDESGGEVLTDVEFVEFEQDNGIIDGETVWNAMASLGWILFIFFTIPSAYAWVKSFF